MKESDLRKGHRSFGLILALFIILQAGSGLLITLSGSGIPHSHAHSEAVVRSGPHEDGKSLWNTSLGFIHNHDFF